MLMRLAHREIERGGIIEDIRITEKLIKGKQFIQEGQGQN